MEQPKPGVNTRPLGNRPECCDLDKSLPIMTGLEIAPCTLEFFYFLDNINSLTKICSRFWEILDPVSYCDPHFLISAR